MISLDIENYCHECSRFEPVANKLYADGEAIMMMVSCQNKNLCANLKQYIEQQIARKEKQSNELNQN